MPLFVGPNSPSPGTDFEAKSDRIGVPNRSSDPSPASAGDVYYNTSDNKLKVHNGTAFVDLGDGSISATGGTKFTSGSKTYHFFTSSSPFVVSGAGEADCFLIGGGGSAGYFYGDGGGAGGAVTASDFPFSAGTYTVTVGSGGAERPQAPGVGNKGGVSEIYLSSPGPSSSNLHALGGGGGGYNTNPSPHPDIHAADIGCTGGSHNPNSAAVPAKQPGITQHPTATNYGNPGWYVGSPTDNGSSGGGTGSAASTNDAGAGQAFPALPGPGLYPSMPGPLQSTLGTAWRDALGTNGYIGGGGKGYNDPTSRSNGGGGGWDNSNRHGINYTGSGGAGPRPDGTGRGGTGLVVIYYDTPS